jgi:hypothetical protein
MFAGYIEHLAPRRLVLLACEAGNWPAAKVLFERLARLEHIFASPVLAKKDFGRFLMAVMPIIAFNETPDEGSIRLLQVASLAATGGQLRQWTRADMNDPDGALLDLFAVAANPIAERIPSILKSLFSK